MNPFTYHYVVNSVRHQKALIAEDIKWFNSPGFSPQEATEALTLKRKMLEAWERSLGNAAVESNRK